MARILIAVFGFCLLALGASPAAHAAKRVAFVVGIDFNYKLPEQQQLRKAAAATPRRSAKRLSEAGDNVGRPTSCGLQPI